MKLIYAVAIVPDEYDTIQPLKLIGTSSGNSIRVEGIHIEKVCKTVDEAQDLISYIKSSIDRLTDPSRLPRTCAAGFADCFCAMNQPSMGRCNYSSTN